MELPTDLRSYRTGFPTGTFSEINWRHDIIFEVELGGFTVWFGTKSMSWVKVSFICGATRFSYLIFCSYFAPCKVIQDSLGFWISDTGFRINSLSVVLGFQIPIAAGFRMARVEFWIPKIKFRIPKPRIPNSTSKRLPGFRNADYLTWGFLLHSKT